MCGPEVLFSASRKATIKPLLFFHSQVEYQSKGFLEKNRDALYEDLLEIMRASKVFIEYFTILR